MWKDKQREGENRIFCALVRHRGQAPPPEHTQGMNGGWQKRAGGAGPCGELQNPEFWGESGGGGWQPGQIKLCFPHTHTPLGEGVGSLGLESARNAFGDLHASDFVML